MTTSVELFVKSRVAPRLLLQIHVNSKQNPPSAASSGACRLPLARLVEEDGGGGTGQS